MSTLHCVKIILINMQIPMLNLSREYECMKEDIDTAVQRCFVHQHWILGKEVEEFEKAASHYLGSTHCIGISSGTDALVLSLRALALKLKGKEFFDSSDEIITTPFTFIATSDAILRAGATPVFVDIDPRTFNIDPAAIRSYLERSPAGQVVGIVPVHLYGQPCNMDAIMEVANTYKCFVLEDTAQAFGARWRNQKVGTIGTMGAFSFFPSKNLGACGDAGMIATDDKILAEYVRMLLQHGGKDKYNPEHIGYNARLDTLQAAILLAKLPHVDVFNEKRRAVAKWYDATLQSVSGTEIPYQAEGAHHVFHQYTIKVNPDNRSQLCERLLAHGISTNVYYPKPLHTMVVFGAGRSRVGGSLVHAEEAATHVLNLPMGPFLTLEECTTVAQAITQEP
ncbi:MAG: Pleiotropic regulatory protein [Parcubacteria group bacterium GW2011_GWC2_45_7]|nr:MAG: Pleiotropic regulatory protein [Parcubacteria group bacterium GW2011_GWC2_45_7]KKU74123.1 MAG: Pleiotropic regulatory protein [Parcubacteria group bacterium GW2011_GWA2_47_26]